MRNNHQSADVIKELIIIVNDFRLNRKIRNLVKEKRLIKIEDGNVSYITGVD